MIHLTNVKDDEELNSFLIKMTELSKNYSFGNQIDGILLKSNGIASESIVIEHRISCGDDEQCPNGMVKVMKIDASGNRYCICVPED